MKYSFKRKISHEILFLYYQNFIVNISQQQQNNSIYREKKPSGSENLLALISVNNICSSKNKNKIIIKKTKKYLNETMSEKQERQKCIC